MKFSLGKNFNLKRNSDLVILLAACRPAQAVLETLSQHGNLVVREAFTTRGVLQNLTGVQLIIQGDLISMPDASNEVLQSALELSGIPVVSQVSFLADPVEWLGRARLAGSKQISFLPARQINLLNWSGGVGKTTLAMAVCKRFVQNTGLPAALLELSMGGSALQARISPNLPEFFAIATHKEKPASWNGVSLYPMDGRSIDVLWSEDPQGVRNLLDEIQRKHTLFVVDCFPGHPLFAELSQPKAELVNLVVTSPRDDAIFQARRLIQEISEPRHLVLNMVKSVADRAESGLSIVLPYNETWAQSLDPRLADPILELVYKGWKTKGR
jgi:cellulose biosynthesis protein BcsQ